MVRRLILALSTLLAGPGHAELLSADMFPQNVLVAQIASVSPDGVLTTVNGSQFTLWALVPSDSERFATFLTGRYVYCYAVQDEKMDCFLYERSDNPVRPISARVWLPDMGLARIDCGGLLQITYGISLQIHGWLFAGAFTCLDGKTEGLSTNLGGPLLPVKYMLTQQGRERWWRSMKSKLPRGSEWPVD